MYRKKYSIDPICMMINTWTQCEGKLALYMIYQFVKLQINSFYTFTYNWLIMVLKHEKI